MSRRAPVQIDRNSGIPIHTQLVSRLRYLIVSGHFSDGDDLPSTRELGRHLGISFHTVRKAYQALVASGHVESRQGRGYRVAHAGATSKSDRMERGASIVHETLQELIGLGLDEQEIEYLIQEQTNLLESEEDEEYKIVLAGPFREWSEDCAAGLSEELQYEIIATTTRELSRHADADFVLVPYRHVRSVLPDLPNADVIGLQAELAGDALEQVSRLLERETLGIVTRYPDAIGPLTTSLRETTGFGGQILAVSVGDGDTHLDPLLQQSELVLFTEAASRVSKVAISKATRSLPLAFAVTSDSVDRLRKLVPH